MVETKGCQACSRPSGLRAYCFTVLRVRSEECQNVLGWHGRTLQVCLIQEGTRDNFIPARTHPAPRWKPVHRFAIWTVDMSRKTKSLWKHPCESEDSSKEAHAIV